MKKNTWMKIIGLCFTVSLVVWMIGGALTNEYLISYLFGQLTQKQEEEFPIVKKVIEEHVYVEDSLIIDAVKNAQPAVVTVYPAKVNGFILTTDGIIVSCNSELLDQDTFNVSIWNNDIVPAKVVFRDSTLGLAYLRIESDGNFYQTLPLENKTLKLGQRTVALTKDTIKSAIVSKVDYENFHMIDREVGDDFKCSPIINLGGELVGLASIQSKDSDTTLVIPAQILEELLVKEVAE